MKPADTNSKTFLVITSAGAAVTGLTISNFTATAVGKAYGGAAATYSSSPTLTEIGSGLYEISWSLPSSAGWFWFSLRANSSAHFMSESFWQGELENQDLDGIYGATTTPIVSVTGQGTVGQVTPISLVADRYAIRTWTFVDSAGAAVDVASGYSNFALSVRSEDQTTTVWDGTNGSPAGFVLTATSNVITAEFIESATFYAAFTAGSLEPVQLYYEITGDLGGDTAKTVPLVQSSPLLLYRQEVGT